MLATRVSVGLGLINAVISAVQEIRAKRKLDGLQLLDHAPVQVLRDGREVELAPESVVRGDVLVLRPGGQIVVDGPLLDGHIEADESLLTGESEPVVKDVGDDLRSAASVSPAPAISSPATSAQAATPGGSPPRPGGPPPTRLRCSAASSSSYGWSSR
jgi:magnesium-transporting ATPase (P-type)